MDAPRIERGSLRCERSVLPLNYRPVEIHSQALSIALSEQTRQRYLCLLSSTNLPFGWWTLTDRRPTNSLMELLFPELKAHYRQMLDSNPVAPKLGKLDSNQRRAFASRLTVCSLLPTRVLPSFKATKNNQKTRLVAAIQFNVVNLQATYSPIEFIKVLFAVNEPLK